MHRLSRLTAVAVVPLLLLLLAGAASWLALAAREDGFGPMRLVPISARSTPAEVETLPLPPNQLEALSAAQARLKNAELPFSSSGARGVAASWRAGDAAEDAASLECLTEAVYYEAARESEAGKRAVAQVVVNRALSAPFPDTICGVVHQGASRPGCQFTFMCDGSLARHPDPALWTESRRIAASALQGATEPLVGGATHYHADYVYPTWAPTMTKLMKIGAHIFYRWRGAVPRAAAAPLIPASLASSSVPDATGREATNPAPLQQPESEPPVAFAQPPPSPGAFQVGVATSIGGTPTGDQSVAPASNRAPTAAEALPRSRRAVPDRPLESSPF